MQLLEIEDGMKVRSLASPSCGAGLIADRDIACGLGLFLVPILL